MYVSYQNISGVELHTFETHKDFRGTFSRFPKRFSEEQENNSYLATAFNTHSLTLRGMHSQTLERPEIKTVFCLSGRVYDVVLDLRKNSNTFGDWTYAHLGPMEFFNGITIPAGCAHGYLTLEVNTSVLYRIDGSYAPELASDVRWDDPTFSIDWPEKPLFISDKDKKIEYKNESEYSRTK